MWLLGRISEGICLNGDINSILHPSMRIVDLFLDTHSRFIVFVCLFYLIEIQEV